MRKLLFIALIGVSLVGYAQEDVLLKDGKVATLLANGTWKYKDVTKESKPLDWKCEHLVMKITDPTTKKSFNALKHPIAVSNNGTGGISIDLYEISEGFYIMKATSATVWNVTKYAGMDIVFTDGTKMEVAHNGKPNQKGKIIKHLGPASGSYGKGHFEQLTTKHVKSITLLCGSLKETQVFDENMSDQLFKALQCIQK